LTEMLVNAGQNEGLIAMGNKRRKYISDALSIVKTPELRKIINTSAIVKTAEGDLAYNFNLPDTGGNMVKLSDLRGNFVLMDMWFTGCGGCMIFSDKVKTQIKPRFTANPRVKFVSISTDPSKEMWIKSLYSGKYTDPDNINLLAQTGQKFLSFFQIPIVKYYGFNYMPFILFIDREGRIVSQFTNDDKVEDIITKIEKAISEQQQF
jgi:cytochrome oxidase Cu insertion factor (SCO1/SenC/PrrC family)